MIIPDSGSASVSFCSQEYPIKGRRKKGIEGKKSDPEFWRHLPICDYDDETGIFTCRGCGDKWKKL